MTFMGPERVTIESFPGENTEPNNDKNWVVGVSRDVYTGAEKYITLDGFEDDSGKFYDSGYHNYNVYNFNYPWLPGKYNVVW